MNTYETPKSIELWLYNDCHKINPSGPFGKFLFYVILTISYLWACSIIPHWKVIITQRFRAACSSKSRYFSGILTAYFNSKCFLLYTRELLGCLLGVSASGWNSCRGNNLMIGCSDQSKNYTRKCFWTNGKEIRIKIENGLALIGLRTTGTCSDICMGQLRRSTFGG